MVTVLGTGTIAAMLKAAWLRNWIYDGPHSPVVVQDLPSDLRTAPALAYSHEITGAVDTGALLVICIVFPLIAFRLTGVAAMSLPRDAAAGQGDPR